MSIIHTWSRFSTAEAKAETLEEVRHTEVLITVYGGKPERYEVGCTHYNADGERMVWLTTHESDGSQTTGQMFVDDIQQVEVLHHA